MPIWSAQAALVMRQGGRLVRRDVTAERTSAVDAFRAVLEQLLAEPIAVDLDVPTQLQPISMAIGVNQRPEGG